MRGGPSIWRRATRFPLRITVERAEPGRIGEADVQFRDPSNSNPARGSRTTRSCTNQRSPRRNGPLFDKMAELTSDGRLPRREIIQLEYGLGKALEDLGEYGEAMRHFDEANRNRS